MAPINYTGALQPKKKGELQDIASSLLINNEGTKEDLTARIKKHLDDNPELEDDSRYSGLYGRRKRSVPPPSTNAVVLQHQKVTRTTSRTLPPLPETPEKVTQKLTAALEGTPSSLPPLPESTAPSLSVVQRLTAALPSGSTKITELVQAHYDHAKVTEGSSELLQSSRSFLSNSLNIWSLTALADLGLILYNVIPWKYAPLSYSPSSSYSSPLEDYSVPYPPLSVFQAPAFWSVIFHWSFPSLIIPALFGYLISFAPQQSSGNVTFDPLTASIVRLAAQLAWTFPSPKAFISPPVSKLEIIAHGVYGLDVLGQRWRVLTAGVALLFAFAEQISKAPAFSAPIAAAPAPNSETAVESISVRPSGRYRAIQEAEPSPEVD